MRFLVDAQLPPSLALWLREEGHEADHVVEVGLGESSDLLIWSRALHTGAAILTKDEDFAVRTGQVETSPVIVWLRVGNSTNRALRAWIVPRLPGIVALVAQGNRLVEVI